MKYFRLHLFPIIVLLSLMFSCKKSTTVPVTSYQLSYSDSIFYINNQTADILASPVNAKAGSFTAFPEGLVINSSTGIINVSQSEAGMRYRINFLGTDGVASTSFIVISGINFPDKYYKIESADTMALPWYNASPSIALPSGIFDENKVANNSGCAMKTSNGQINLIQSIRNGLFGNTPKNDTRKDFEVVYRLNDKSNNALNKIKILIYYYNKMSDVPTTLVQTVLDHQAMTFQPNNTTVGNVIASNTTAKPRPPCIIIIGHNN